MHSILVPFSVGLLSWSHVGFCKRLFLHLLRLYMIFVFKPIYMIYYSYWLTYVELSLNLWNKSQLDHGVWSFCSVSEFHLQEFCWELLYSYSSKMLTYSLLFLLCCHLTFWQSSYAFFRCPAHAERQDHMSTQYTIHSQGQSPHQH